MAKKNTIIGALKLVGLIDRLNFTSWRDFVSAIPSLFSVELPLSASGIIFSREQPGPDDVDKLWVYRTSSGSINGIYTFQQGEWTPFYGVADQEIREFYGDSDNPPKGWLPILLNDAVIPSTVVNALVSRYVPGPSDNYIFYSARYVGF